MPFSPIHLLLILLIYLNLKAIYIVYAVKATENRGNNAVFKTEKPLNPSTIISASIILGSIGVLIGLCFFRSQKVARKWWVYVSFALFTLVIQVIWFYLMWRLNIHMS